MAMDEIFRLQSDAEKVIARLGEQTLPDDDTVRAAAERVRQRAVDIIRQAKDPIRLGVVGEFSIGKSMLVGTLLGKPDLLPVEERPTTGNVTALYLKPGPPGAGTAFTDVPVVDFLSRQELTECVEYVIKELIKKVDDVMPSADASPLAGYDPVNQGWDRLEQWCRKYLWPAGGAIGGLEPRKIAVELLQIRDAQLSAEAVLGKETTVPEEAIRAALDLGTALGVPDEYPQRNVRPGLTIADCKAGGDGLARCFPLIRRVSYTVAVDPERWALSGLRDQTDVVLLDFPGLTASRSAKRDEYLSRNELRTIHTIITVFGSAKPDNDIPHRFYGMLESHSVGAGELRDWIIAVCNAFDLMSVPDLPGDGPVTLADLRAASQKFAGFSHNASDLIQHRDDRIRLTSSVVAIGHYGFHTSFGSQENDHLSAALRAAAGKAAGWGAIGARMRAAEPDSPWAEALLAFAEDGGIASLRQLIEEHAQKHGVQNKISNLQREWKRLRASVESLVLLLPPDELVPGQAQHGRALLTQLFDEVRLQHSALVEAAQEFADPARVCYQDKSIVENVRIAALSAVATWPEWRRIIQTIQSGLIPQSTEPDSEPDSGEDDDPFASVGRAGGAPDTDTTDAFFRSYSSTLAKAVAAAREELTGVVKQWVQERDAFAEPLQTRLGDPAVLDVLTAGLDRLRAAEGSETDRLAALRLLAEVGWVTTRLESQLKKSGGMSADEMEMSFPLRRAAALPWHVAFPEDETQPDQAFTRHQTYLFRLRRELAAAAADAVGQRVAADIEDFRQRLLTSLRRGYKLIPTDVDIHTMFPPDELGGTAPSDGGPDPDPDPNGSPMRALLREWRAQDAESGV